MTAKEVTCRAAMERLLSSWAPEAIDRNYRRLSLGRVHLILVWQVKSTKKAKAEYERDHAERMRSLRLWERSTTAEQIRESRLS